MRGQGSFAERRLAKKDCGLSERGSMSDRMKAGWFSVGDPVRVGV